MDAMEEVTLHLEALCLQAEEDGVEQVFLFCPSTLRQVWAMHWNGDRWEHSIYLPGEIQCLTPEQIQ